MEDLQLQNDDLHVDATVTYGNKLCFKNHYELRNIAE